MSVSAVTKSPRCKIYADVVEQTGKPESLVKAYYKVFWERYQEIADWQKIIDRIERGEKRIERNKAIQEAIATKVLYVHLTWTQWIISLR